MKRTLVMHVRLLAAVSLLATSACEHSWYAPPRAEEPHATLDVRLVLERTAGATLAVKTSVSGHPFATETFPVTEATAGTPIQTSVLVRPRPARFTVVAAFSHPEMRWIMQSYQEQQSQLETEYYYCGKSLQCSRLVTRYHTVTKYRPAFVSVDVSDGACSASYETTPEVGHSYLLDFTYRADGSCRVACYQEGPAEEAAGGQRRFCRPATGDENKVIDEDLEEAGGE
jgi:hypothetical protein